MLHPGVERCSAQESMKGRAVPPANRRRAVLRSGVERCSAKKTVTREAVPPRVSVERCSAETEGLPPGKGEQRTRDERRQEIIRPGAGRMCSAAPSNNRRVNSTAVRVKGWAGEWGKGWLRFSPPPVCVGCCRMFPPPPAPLPFRRGGCLLTWGRHVCKEWNVTRDSPGREVYPTRAKARSSANLQAWSSGWQACSYN